MKNLVISALVVGALACPVAFAEEMKGANPAPEATTSEADATKHKHHKKAKHKKHKAGKKHKRAHHKIHKEHKHHHHHKAHGETQAEKQIDKETELNNR